MKWTKFNTHVGEYAHKAFTGEKKVWIYAATKESRLISVLLLQVDTQILLDGKAYLCFPSVVLWSRRILLTRSWVDSVSFLFSVGVGKVSVLLTLDFLPPLFCSHDFLTFIFLIHCLNPPTILLHNLFPSLCFYATLVISQ